MKKRKLILTIVVFVFVVLLFSNPILAESNLEKGKDLFMSTREDFYSGEDENIVEELEKTKEIFSKVKDDYKRNYWQGRIEYLLAEVYEAYGEEGKAENYFERANKMAKKILNEKSTSNAHTLLAESYMRQFNHKGIFYTIRYGNKSLKLLERAIEMNKNNYRAFNSLGHYLYFAPEIGGGNKKRSIKAFQKALASDRKYDRFTANIWLGIVMRDNEDNIEAAKKYFKRAKEIYPDNPWIKEEINKI